MDEELPRGGVELSATEIDALEARWSSAWTPAEVAHRLAGFAGPWYVAAGWALDLFLGTQTREHGDIEIAVPAARFPDLRTCFPGYAFDVVSDGRLWENATPEALAGTWQTWLRDPATGRYMLDVFRERHDEDTWICRRDATIRLPYGDIVQHTAQGIPYLVPELVLLFKAKHTRPKDQEDFDRALPHLTSRQRTTLVELLRRVHPAHPWIDALD